MRKIFVGIVALIIPVFLFAQTGKEVQDLNLIQKKVAVLEKENSQLKKQLQGVQKAITSWNQAELAEQLEMKKQDSVMKAAQDTVQAYSSKILKLQEDIGEIENAMKMRTVGFLIVALIILAVIGIRWFVHSKSHKEEVAALEDKMQAQKAEREQRIGEVYARMQAQKEERDAKIAELMGMVKTHESKGDLKFIELHDKLHTHKEEREQRISEVLAKIHATNDEQDRKLADLRTLIEQQGKDLVQKVTDSGKKLDEQIISAHKKADELKTVLARELEAIRSKFE